MQDLSTICMLVDDGRPTPSTCCVNCLQYSKAAGLNGILRQNRDFEFRLVLREISIRSTGRCLGFHFSGGHGGREKMQQAPRVVSRVLQLCNVVPNSIAPKYCKFKLLCEEVVAGSIFGNALSSGTNRV